MNTIIYNEWEKLQQRPVEELLAGFDWDGLFGSISTYAKNELALEARLNKSIRDYWPNGAEWTAANVTPKLTSLPLNKQKNNWKNRLEN